VTLWHLISSTNYQTFQILFCPFERAFWHHHLNFETSIQQIRAECLAGHPLSSGLRVPVVYELAIGSRLAPIPHANPVSGISTRFGGVFGKMQSSVQWWMIPGLCGVNGQGRLLELRSGISWDVGFLLGCMKVVSLGLLIVWDFCMVLLNFRFGFVCCLWELCLVSQHGSKNYHKYVSHKGVLKWYDRQLSRINCCLLGSPRETIQA
jgi:hypothetical protein